MEDRTGTEESEDEGAESADDVMMLLMLVSDVHHLLSSLIEAAEWRNGASASRFYTK